MTARIIVLAVAAALVCSIASAVVISASSDRDRESSGSVAGPGPTATSTAEPTPTYAVFSDFQALTLAELDEVLVKLTHVGIQERPILTLIVTTSATAPDVTYFHRFGGRATTMETTSLSSSTRAQ